MDSDIYNPTIPFCGSLPQLLQPGNLIRISGTVSNSATCFSINLQNGSNSYQRSDISFHLSPVFSSPPRIVRNSLENQQWGPEESHGPEFPLAVGQRFEILILVEKDHFKVAVNGQHFTEFQYRLPLQSITHIAVDGDVTIDCIKFEGLAKSPMAGTGEGVSKPLGFMIDSNIERNLAPPPSGGRPPSPYDTSLPYPTNFGPSPPSFTPENSPSNPYGPPGYNPYGPPPSGGNYGVPPLGGSSYGPPQSGGSSYGPPPSSGYNYGPPPSSNNPYGPPPSGNNPYGPPGGGYPSQQGYPGQGGYPTSNLYPTQQGPYPGTSVVYPGQEKKSESGMNLGPLAAAGAAALAGVAGSTILGGKHKKHKKHGYGVPGMGGLGPAALMGGVSSLMGGNKHGHKGSSSLPIPGGALAGGAAALAGAYMLSKSPVGKMMKPKKMKKLYKHKSGWGSSSSSSSSSD
ncbi:galectin-8 [Trichonephila inaurata madagascariensis]|uniref:Galectin n=1 Tax=Trichonephila inaurata madagascariensis TaxID=2747483 RepID=A0A8X7CAV1_9ARAC|nr:galectin-8 [Trichonephila inaurata madagascariensis]